MRTFSERLAAYRKKMGLKQDELADMLGVSREYVSMLERGSKTVEEKSSLSRLLSLYEERAASGSPLAVETKFGSDTLREEPNLRGREALKWAREAKGLSVRELAKAVGYSVSTYQALEEGHSFMSEKMAEKIAKILNIDVSILMDGSEEPPSRGGMYGTVGADPGIQLPPGMKARYVPLLSMAQCGRMRAYDDTAFTQNDGFLVFNPEDRQTFVVKLEGDSMPPYGAGDVAIVYPNVPPVNGDHVIARLNDEDGGDVMFKLYQSNGEIVRLSSSNYALYPPMDFKRSQFTWIYTVAEINKKLRKI